MNIYDIYVLSILVNMISSTVLREAYHAASGLFTGYFRYQDLNL
jgi:hypothetical protein